MHAELYSIVKCDTVEAVSACEVDAGPADVLLVVPEALAQEHALGVKPQRPNVPASWRQLHHHAIRFASTPELQARHMRSSGGP